MYKGLLVLNWFFCVLFLYMGGLLGVVVIKIEMIKLYEVVV